LQRIAFQLRIREGMMDAYDEAHLHVWPELMKELESLGVKEYSIFRRDQQLFLYMHIADFKELVDRLSVSEVNLRWQEAMAPFFEPVPGLRADEPFAMMKEVFYMHGAVNAESSSASESKPSDRAETQP